MRIAFVTSLGHSEKKRKRKQSAAGVQKMRRAQKDGSRKNNSLPPYFFFSLLSRHAALQLCERVKQVSRVLCFSPPRPPSASANKTFLDLYNCSVHTQPHPTITKYLTTSSLAYFPTSASDGLHVWHSLGPLGCG